MAFEHHTLFGTPSLSELPHEPATLWAFLIGEVAVNPGLLAVAAVVMVWMSFLRPAWSDRLQFSAALILSATVLLGGVEIFTGRYLGFVYGSTVATSGVVTYGCLLASARAMKNRLLAVLASVMIVWSCAYPVVWKIETPLAVLGGVLLAGTIFSFGGFFAEKAGVKPFAVQ